jgi:hypothetical protein
MSPAPSVLESKSCISYEKKPSVNYNRTPPQNAPDQSVLTAKTQRARRKTETSYRQGTKTPGKATQILTARETKRAKLWIPAYGLRERQSIQPRMDTDYTDQRDKRKTTALLSFLTRSGIQGLHCVFQPLPTADRFGRMRTGWRTGLWLVDMGSPERPRDKISLFYGLFRASVPVGADR